KAELKDFSFAKDVEKATRNKYLEVDLYVPEYIEGDKDLTAEAWYKPYLKLPHDKATLVKRGASSYIIVFPRTPTAAAREQSAPEALRVDALGLGGRLVRQQLVDAEHLERLREALQRHAPLRGHPHQVAEQRAGLRVDEHAAGRGQRLEARGAVDRHAHDGEV